MTQFNKDSLPEGNVTIKIKKRLSPLAKRVKALRTRRGWTQTKLAEVAGISRHNISRVETGIGDPSLFNAMCIAKALQVPLDFLVYGERSHHEP